MKFENTGTYHLADNPQLYEPSRTNNFEFVVMDIDNLVRAGAKEDNITQNDYIANAQEILRISVVTATVPNFELGVLDVKRGNNTTHFAGVPTFPSGSIKLNDYMGARTKDALMAWQALAYDVRTEKVKRATNYKKTCYLYELDPEGNVIRKIRMIGCWISNLNEPDFDGESNDKRTVTATIIYDKAIPMLPDEVA